MPRRTSPAHDHGRALVQEAAMLDPVAAAEGGPAFRAQTGAASLVARCSSMSGSRICLCNIDYGLCLANICVCRKLWPSVRGSVAIGP